jgi:GTP cyclohydrolase I
MTQGKGRSADTSERGVAKYDNSEHDILDDLTQELGNGGSVPTEALQPGRIEAAVRDILLDIGEDPDREGLVKTPERVRRMYHELTAGYAADPHALVNDALFETESEGMIMVRDIEFYSLCEHHLLPFFGLAHIGYIADGRIIGLSKIPRIVEMFARRLQIQERLTKQIAEFLQQVTGAKGVGVVLEGTHLCTIMRGVRKPGTRMVTSTVLGTFRSDPRTRAEFMDHLSRSQQHE